MLNEKDRKKQFSDDEIFKQGKSTRQSRQHMFHEKVLNLFQMINSSKMEDEVSEILFEIHHICINIYEVFEVNFFCENFPFERFFDIFLNHPDEATKSWAIQCIGFASDKNPRCCELMLNESNIICFLDSLKSNDKYICDSVILLISNVIHFSKDDYNIRNCFLEKGLIDILMDKEITYSIATLLLNICKTKDIDIETIKKIEIIILKILDGANYDILELALSCIIALYENIPDFSVEFCLDSLPQILLSGIPGLVKNATQIVYYSNVPEKFFEILLQTLDMADSQIIIHLISLCFEKSQVILDEEIFSIIFQAFYRKLSFGTYKTQVDCIRVMLKYLPENAFQKIDFFSIVLGFIESPEIGFICIRYIHHVIEMESNIQPDIYQQMMEKMSENINTFQEIYDNEENEEKSEVIRFCIEKIENYTNLS